MFHSSYNVTVIIISSKLHCDSISRWRTRFLHSNRLHARSRTLLKKRFSCERALKMFESPEQQQSTSIECKYECPCRQHSQRVSGVADEWCLTEELVTCTHQRLLEMMSCHRISAIGLEQMNGVYSYFLHSNHHSVEWLRSLTLLWRCIWMSNETQSAEWRYTECMHHTDGVFCLWSFEWCKKR